MKIARVSTKQFAGINDKEIRFDKGLNIIIGENEAGKSTIVDLIYYLLLKPSKLDGRKDVGKKSNKDKKFVEKYFPNTFSGQPGNVIDGTLCIETENGEYEIYKEWALKGECSTLVMPDGKRIKGDEAVKKALDEELLYGEGVYNEIVFASQKRQQQMVESIMNAIPTKEQKQLLKDIESNLISILTQAALETGGISLVKLETELAGKLNMYGARWGIMPISA